MKRNMGLKCFLFFLLNLYTAPFSYMPLFFFQWQSISITLVEKVQMIAVILGSLFLIASVTWLLWSAFSPYAVWQRKDILFQICYGMYGFMDLVCIGKTVMLNINRLPVMHFLQLLYFHQWDGTQTVTVRMIFILQLITYLGHHSLPTFLKKHRICVPQIFRKNEQDYAHLK